MIKIFFIVILVLSQNLFAQDNLLVPVYNESNQIGVDKFWAEIYSNHLISFKENNLQDYKCNCEVYRFLWLRSFHNPVAITITKNNKKISLNWKRTDVDGDYETGRLVEDKTISLSSENWDKFKELLKASNYWETPSILIEDNKIEVLDGASWVIEGLSKNKYHISEVNVENIGRFLIKNTEMNIPENEIY